MERDKDSGDAWAGRGQVRLRRAAWNDRRSTQPLDAQGYASAVEDLEHALRVNPSLEREVAPVLAETRKKLTAAQKP